MQFDKITEFFGGLEQSMQLPLWAIITISILCPIFFLHLYNLYSVISNKNQKIFRKIKSYTKRFKGPG